MAMDMHMGIFEHFSTCSLSLILSHIQTLNGANFHSFNPSGTLNISEKNVTSGNNLLKKIHDSRPTKEENKILCRL